MCRGFESHHQPSGDVAQQVEQRKLIAWPKIEHTVWILTDKIKISLKIFAKLSEDLREVCLNETN